MSRNDKTLEIDGPSASCGYCRFTSALEGTWSVEDGLLVWRAAPDPQPRRGPDLHSCCEGRDCGSFDGITADRQALSDEDVTALRATVQQEHKRQWREWENA